MKKNKNNKKQKEISTAAGFEPAREFLHPVKYLSQQIMTRKRDFSQEVTLWYYCSILSVEVLWNCLNSRTVVEKQEKEKKKIQKSFRLLQDLNLRGNVPKDF